MSHTSSTSGSDSIISDFEMLDIPDVQPPEQHSHGTYGGPHQSHAHPELSTQAPQQHTHSTHQNPHSAAMNRSGQGERSAQPPREYDRFKYGATPSDDPQQEPGYGQPVWGPSPQPRPASSEYIHGDVGPAPPNEPNSAEHTPPEMTMKLVWDSAAQGFKEVHEKLEHHSQIVQNELSKASQGREALADRMGKGESDIHALQVAQHQYRQHVDKELEELRKLILDHITDCGDQREDFRKQVVADARKQCEQMIAEARAPVQQNKGPETAQRIPRPPPTNAGTSPSRKLGEDAKRFKDILGNRNIVLSIHHDSCEHLVLCVYAPDARTCLSVVVHKFTLVDINPYLRVIDVSVR